jgi:hypothetical protein
MRELQLNAEAESQMRALEAESKQVELERVDAAIESRRFDILSARKASLS